MARASFFEHVENFDDSIICLDDFSSELIPISLEGLLVNDRSSQNSSTRRSPRVRRPSLQSDLNLREDPIHPRSCGCRRCHLKGSYASIPRHRRLLGNTDPTIFIDLSESLTEQENKNPQVSLALGDCCICLQSMVNVKMATIKCGHVFCEGCIRRALKDKNECPKCRKKASSSNIIPLFF